MPHLSAERCRSSLRRGCRSRCVGEIRPSGIISLPPLCRWRHAMVPTSPGDSKLTALATYGAVHPHPEAITDSLVASSAFLDARDLVQMRYEMVHRVQVDGQAVTQVAAAFGVSRQ